MWRAHEVFALEHVLVFTQAYHLPRALYIGRRLGLDIRGVAPPKQADPNAARVYLREMFARIKAFIDVEILASEPKRGE